MKKRNFSVVLCAVLAIMSSVSVYAASDSDSGYLTGGYSCGAYLSVDDDSYSAYAETTADRGLDSNPNDYISVSVTFAEYNDDYSASYPTTPEYPSYNVGPNFTMARVNATGWNPDYVSGSHYVQRGAYGWSGSTSVSYTSGS